MSARPRVLAKVAPILGSTLLLACAMATSCSTPEASARVDPIGPDLETFKHGGVSTMLENRCGSLDCHGSRFRNLRLYGYGGLRLPGSAPSPLPEGYDTSEPELDANYDAVIGLEPEIMRDVVKDKGAHPERLTLVRKPRGGEHHKGKIVIAVGDDADKCLLSWLASATDTSACARAIYPWSSDAGYPGAGSTQDAASTDDAGRITDAGAD